MNKNILLIALCIFSLTSFAQKKEKIKGNKEVTTIDNKISKTFSSLAIDDGLEVLLNQGRKNSYTLTTDENLQGVIQFSVEDSVLKIYTTHKIVSRKKLKIRLNYISLSDITLKNDARVESEGKLESANMHITAYESSRFKLDLATENLIITMHSNAGGKLKSTATNATIRMNDRTDLKATILSDSTSVMLANRSELKLTGDSDAVSFNLKDNATLQAKDMLVRSANLYASSNADIYVYASEILELYADGKSNIYVYGDPKLDVTGLADKSKIIKR